MHPLPFKSPIFSEILVSKKNADIFCKVIIEKNRLTPCFPAGNYMFKVNNRNTRTRCEICSKLTIKIPVYWYLYC